MARRVVFLLLPLAIACAGKSPEPPPRPISSTAPPAAQSVPPPVAAPGADVAGLAPSELDALAPEPRIRVGLSTTARVLRLTSSRPFKVGAAGERVVTQDVLVEPVASAVVEGSVYRVELGSFPTRAQADDYRATMREEIDDDLILWREPGTGRFAVRLGAFASESGAAARKAELVALGFETAEIVREPTRMSRPQELVLRPVGQSEVRTSSLVLVAAARAPGAWIELDGAPYRGYLEIFVNASNTFTVVNVVNLEDYLKGVVPAELSPRAFPEKEAIKAQALAARTYAIKRRSQFASEGYDICATAACQVYGGVAVEQPMATEAVLETTGEVLTYQGRLVDALYTSTCGGRTENSENVFSTAEPYLVSRACFREAQGETVRSAAPAPLSLEAAALSLLGIVPVQSPAGGTSDPNAPASAAEARRWTENALAHLGQTPCWTSPAPPAGSALDVAGLARLLGEGLCWERRLPFLISSADAARIVPVDAAGGLRESNHLYLAYAVQEVLLRPRPTGIHGGESVTRREVVETLYRLIDDRGEPPLGDGTLVRIDNGRLFVKDETLGDEDNEISTFLAPERYLYRGTRGESFFTSELDLLPGDRIRFRMGDAGIDLLVLDSIGASFDRSSRLSHWVVRKSNEDLSKELDLRRGVGEVLDLLPLRYGRSGRIVELRVVGTAATSDLTGLEVRRALSIRENLFFIDTQRRADGTVDAWVFTGRGWGHGVGMCQVGAYGMAAAGYDYREILAHYYTGTVVETRETTASQQSMVNRRE